ncbi:hypothetical protein QAD02_012316 [Eretmocerus hayati]|uniref:Uncharacterized protein n=1 Tax=Eretmocerus hayati TaxID=131215 RepID=A0ACC2NZK3_9HYME|nr:hypothetical protein QAD02_012316 [Eretmocerus hayati]
MVPPCIALQALPNFTEILCQIIVHKACPASKGKGLPGRPHRLLQRGSSATRGEPEATRLQQQQRPITKQPVSFTKEPANGAPGSGGPPSSLSIVCERCGKCRCESCREPPPLPSRWLCNDACFCSAETALDYASCLCCVKGMFYHCADGGLAGSAAAASSTSLDSADLGPSCADEPCSCGGPRRAARWTCLGALAFLLPCLLCYWPLKGCVAVAESCYAKHASHGCRCEPHQLLPQQQQQALSRDPEKRLLEPLEL